MSRDGAFGLPLGLHCKMYVLFFFFSVLLLTETAHTKYVLSNAIWEVCQTYGSQATAGPSEGPREGGSYYF